MTAFLSVSGPRRSKDTLNEKQYEENQKDEEQYLRDSGGDDGYTAKTEEARDQGNQ
jgi:hypothetical protein